MLGPLPPALCRSVFKLVPVDTRLRCREVARAWRDHVSDRSLWTRLDLSAAGGVAPERVTVALLNAAVARAGGDLETLVLEGKIRIDPDAVVAVAAAHARTLRETWLPSTMPGRELRAHVAAVLRAAPALREVHATSIDPPYCSVADVREMLCTEPPWGVVRFHALAIVDINVSAADWRALWNALAAHISLCEMCVFLIDEAVTPLSVVVDAALVLRLPRLRLAMQHPVSNIALQLARLLRGGAIEVLSIVCLDSLLLPGGVDAANELAAALCDSTSLNKLILMNLDWSAPELGVPLLRALIGHPLLRSLCVTSTLNGNRPTDSAVCVAFGALVVANAPALKKLEISNAALDDFGLHHLVVALPHNTHLRELNFRGNAMSAYFGRHVLLPALRANTSLRSVIVVKPGEEATVDELTSALVKEIDELLETRRCGDELAAAGATTQAA